jgi:hypothetical protein
MQKLIKDERHISLFTGVGGQGILLASTVLASACVNSGFDVKSLKCMGWPKGEEVSWAVSDLQKKSIPRP